MADIKKSLNSATGVSNSPSKAKSAETSAKVFTGQTSSEKAGPPTWEFKISQRNYDFETQIDNFVINTQARLLAVMRTAISRTIDDAQTPTAKGGKMRVDTGFLRASGQASLEGIPAGPSKPVKDTAYAYNGDALNVVLAKMQIGDSFFWGWTAKYAKYREAYDGFLEASLQNWQTRVNAVVNIFKNKGGQ